MAKVYKLRKKASEQTGFESLYARTLGPQGPSWSEAGTLFNKSKILDFIQKYYISLPVGTDIPVDWEIVEYEVILSKVHEPHTFTEKLNKIPLIKI